MNIMMTAGLSDQKLISKIAPIANLDTVENIFLFRREPLVYHKVSCFSPPRFMRWSRVISEIYRVFACLVICCRKNVDWIIGIHYFPHCLVAALMGFLLRKKYIMVITEEPQLYERKPLFWNVARRAERIAVRGGRSQAYLISKGLLEGKVFTPPNVFYFKVFLNHPIKISNMILFLSDILSGIKG